MRTIKSLLILLLALILIASPISAQESLQCNDEHIDIHYFYSNGCAHCADVEPLIEKISADNEKYPDVIAHYHEIHNGDDHSLFEIACREFSIDIKGVPLVVIGDTHYQGSAEIIENLEDKLADTKPKDYNCILSCSNIEDITITDDKKEKLELTWPLIIASGLIDGINPCAFAVLIFLAATLMMVGSRKKMIMTGTAYIVAVYVTYFIAGFGLLSIVQYAGMTRIIFYLAAAIAIIFGLINIKDFFWYGKGITLQIPVNKKGIISEYAKKATIPSAVVLGFLVSLFELPCTGGVYFAIIGLLSSKMTQIAAIPYLLVYNLAFIAPLIVILAIIYKGVDPKTVDSWRLKERKWMRLAMGLLMVGLGVMMIGGIV